MAYVAAISSSFPKGRYSQEEIIAVLKRYWSAGHSNLKRLEQIHRNTTVKYRHLALPLEEYGKLSGFGQSNRYWIETALALGEETICKLLDQLKLPAKEISMLASTTVTGIAVPSIDARLMNRIPFPRNMKRMPLFGLGCLAGAAGVARVSDYLKGHPEEAAILLSIELCSLTLQREDLSIENIVSSALFGDGAAAVLLVGDKHPLANPSMPQVADSCSVFFPDSEHVMGWDIRDSGLKVLLSADVAAIAERELPLAARSFLEEHDLTLADISHWITHPGGPKVLEAIEKGLELPPNALELSWQSLASVGNISSTSVLLIFKDTLEKKRPSPGSRGVLMSMGPAFCAEMVLLKW
jgi:alkylresorcinol/alkylpyrone synthase